MEPDLAKAEDLACPGPLESESKTAVPNLFGTRDRYSKENLVPDDLSWS